MGNIGVPTFLCIGAQKAGTSWLNQNLHQHPEIWTPPLKELHYFDIKVRSPIILHMGRSSPSGARFKWAMRTIKRDPLWTFRYVTGYRTDAWYRSLFRPSPHQICGETTPDYAPMQKEKIAHVKAAVPETYLIYLLREPTDRIWSQTKMSTLNHLRTHVDQLPEAFLQAFIEKTWLQYWWHINYANILARWQQYFPADRIMVAFYDQLVADPAGLYMSVLNFLGVEASEHLIPKEITIPRNARPAKPIPENLHRWLTAKLYPQIEEIHEHFHNSYTARWLEQAQRRL